MADGSKKEEKPIIHIRDASFVYGLGDNAPVFSSLNLDLYQNENAFLFGGSGSGKTSIVKAIMGLLHLSDGSYEAFNRDMRNPSARTLLAVRRKIGFLPERGILISQLSVLGNMVFPLRFVAQLSKKRSEDIALALLEEHNLLEIKDCLPFELSINMIKSVGLLRALIFKPVLLLLDDPFEGLDLEGFRFFQKIFGKLRTENEMTLFFLTRKPIFVPGLFAKYYELSPDGDLMSVDCQRIEHHRLEFTMISGGKIL
ncbi:MAG: ATP-binding cassette domain-containing protein [Nitrospirae bacterium]|nr:ATP-binding cassette domain-containing protein [Nitrospirota bacterium]